MTDRRILHVGLLVAIAYFINPAHAQDTFALPPAPAEQNPDPASAAVKPAVGLGYNTGPVMPTGLSVPARMMNRPAVKSSDKQIRVKIHYVLLDQEARAAMYAKLDHFKLQTVGNQVPVEHADRDPQTAMTGTEVIGKSSHVTTCVLDDQEVGQILMDISKQPMSNVSRVPSVILIDGQKANVTDLVQRPFVVDLKRNVVPGGVAVNTVTQVLDEGTSIQLSAKTTKAGTFQLDSELRLSKLIGIETEQVFGVRAKPVSVQVPIHHQSTTQVFQELKPGQTLLIDPYVKQSTEVRKELKSPVPYVGKLFKNTAITTLEQYLVVMLQPSIERSIPELPNPGK